MTKQITESEIRKIVENVIKGVSADTGKKWTSTEYMGRRLIGVYTDMNEAIDAAVLLAKIGINVGAEIRCIICETDFNHDFVQHELMMPILPIVRVDNIEEAIDLAVKAEHGNRHTAHMHSKNIDRLSAFARAVETTIFVKTRPPTRASALAARDTPPLPLQVLRARGLPLRAALPVSVVA